MNMEMMIGQHHRKNWMKVKVMLNLIEGLKMKIASLEARIIVLEGIIKKPGESNENTKSTNS